MRRADMLNTTARIFLIKSMGSMRKCRGLSWLIPISALTFFMCTAFYSASYAGIPEPGIVLYGKVYDEDGSLLTSGELEWTFIPTGGGTPITVTTRLAQIEADGGPYSYRVTIPLEQEIPGIEPSGEAIPISDIAGQYTRTARLKGTSITRTDTVQISMDNRGTFEMVSLGSPKITDTDTDGLDDSWERMIVEADPDDDVVDIGDVDPYADFDNDGESNLDEFYHGTDPTDAFSTYQYENAYTSFHFEIYREAEQSESDDFVESFWGAKLICWPREGETIESGSITKPGLTMGDQELALAVSPGGDEAISEETDYESVDELMEDYVPGEYRVKLVMNGSGQDTYTLRFKIKVKSYGEEDFPDYVVSINPLPGDTNVPVTPLFEFGAGIWDYLYIAKADNGEIAYFHFRDNNDLPPTTHQVPGDHALQGGLAYLLGVDVNRWGTTWLGSQTIVPFVAEGQLCKGDMDGDRDVDGKDLSLFIDALEMYSLDADLNEDETVDEEDVAEFAKGFGKVTCP